MALVVGFTGSVPSGASAQAPADPAVASTPDTASDDAARVLFDAGRRAYDEGRYQDALGHFERAHALSGRPELLYNVALAHDRLRHDDLALGAFREYLALAPESAPHRVEVAARIEVLERSIAEREALEARAAAALTEDAPRRPLVRRWWLWTAIGTVAAIAIVVPVVVTRDRTEAATPSDFGGPVVLRFKGAR